MRIRARHPHSKLSSVQYGLNWLGMVEIFPARPRVYRLQDCPPKLLDTSLLYYIGKAGLNLLKGMETVGYTVGVVSRNGNYEIYATAL